MATAPSSPATSAGESAYPELWSGLELYYYSDFATDITGQTGIASRSSIGAGSTDYGPGLSFDGSDVIKLASDPLANAEAATLVAVVKPSAIDGNNPIFEAGSTTQAHYALWLDNAGTAGGATNCVSFDTRVYGPESGPYRTESSTDSISLGETFVIAARVSTEDLAEIWVNGADRTQYQGDKSDVPMISAGPLQFGQGALGGLKASASALYAYSRRLSDDEMAQISADPYAPIRKPSTGETISIGTTIRASSNMRISAGRRVVAKSHIPASASVEASVRRLMTARLKAAGSSEGQATGSSAVTAKGQAAGSSDSNITGSSAAQGQAEAQAKGQANIEAGRQVASSAAASARASASLNARVKRAADIIADAQSDATVSAGTQTVFQIAATASAESGVTVKPAVKSTGNASIDAELSAYGTPNVTVGGDTYIAAGSEAEWAALVARHATAIALGETVATLEQNSDAPQYAYITLGGIEIQPAITLGRTDIQPAITLGSIDIKPG